MAFKSQMENSSAKTESGPLIGGLMLGGTPFRGVMLATRWIEIDQSLYQVCIHRGELNGVIWLRPCPSRK